MIVKFHKNFDKYFKKLNLQQKLKFQERITLFLSDQHNPILNNHPLKGEYLSYRSINVTGDLRAIYKQSGEYAIFVKLDNHSNLYG